MTHSEVSYARYEEPCWPLCMIIIIGPLIVFAKLSRAIDSHDDKKILERLKIILKNFTFYWTPQILNDRTRENWKNKSILKIIFV